MKSTLGIPPVFRGWDINELPESFSAEKKHIVGYVDSIDKRVEEGRTIILDMGDFVLNCSAAGYILREAYKNGYYYVTMLSAEELYTIYKASWNGTDYYSELETGYDLVAVHSIDDTEFLGKYGIAQLNRYIEKRIFNKKATILVGDSSKLSSKVNQLVKKYAVRIGKC